MCVKADFSNPVRLEEDLYAYKVVKDDYNNDKNQQKFFSCMPPSIRSPQDPLAEYLYMAGGYREYTVGKNHVSWFRYSPGFYLFFSIFDAKFICAEYNKHSRDNFTVLEARIPKKSKVVFGKYRGRDTINAEFIQVLSELHTAHIL